MYLIGHMFAKELYSKEMYPFIEIDWTSVARGPASRYVLISFVKAGGRSSHHFLQLSVISAGLAA